VPNVYEQRTHILPKNPFNFLDNIYSSGCGTGIAASSHRASTMQGPTVSTCMNILHNFFNNSRDLWAPPSYTHTHTFCVCVSALM